MTRTRTDANASVYTRARVDLANLPFRLPTFSPTPPPESCASPVPTYVFFSTRLFFSLPHPFAFEPHNGIASTRNVS